MPDQFVNPSPKMSVSHFLSFDFPVYKNEYVAKKCLPNINIDAPAIEQLYGKLGYPKQEQGHPCIREYPLAGQPVVEAEDPNVAPFQDQVLDIERGIQINHTGRLSGTFARYLACDRFYSRVRIFAHPLAPSEGNPVVLYDKTVSLEPQANAANVWFWKDATRSELLYTAHADVYTKKLLKQEQIYKLIVKWEFYEKNGKYQGRMPILMKRLLSR
jgi:hypothetical protein